MPANLLKRDTGTGIFLWIFTKFFRTVLLIESVRKADFADIESVIQRCSVKKVFLEISQNSQQNICASGLQLY